MASSPFYAWAEFTQDGPLLPPPKPGSVQAKGRAFETRTRKLLQRECLRLGWTLQYNPWIVYGTVEGIVDGFAQPDIFIQRPKDILLLECKLSYTEMAWRQLARYEAMLELIFGQPVVCLQVCRHIWQGIPYNILDSLPAALNYTGRPTVWHNTR